MSETFQKRFPEASLRQTVDVVPSKRLKLTLSITDVEARRGEKLTPC